jgi:phosphoglycerate kinase
MAARPGFHRTVTRQQAIDIVLTPAKDIQLQNFEGKLVLLRADFNVPLDKDGHIADNNRITAEMPTIDVLVKQNAKLVIASHLGRPQPGRQASLGALSFQYAVVDAVSATGKQSLEEMRAKYSLAPVAAELKKRLGDRFVGMASDCVGEEVTQRIKELQPGQVLLLENTRFHAGDTKNDDAFAKQLANGADVFVSDGFGVVHRDQASVTGVTKYIKEKFPGLLVRKEVRCLGERIDHPRRPFAAILGGAKVVDKIHFIDVLIDKVDKVLIGGKMAFTFLKAQGINVGNVAVEEEQLEVARGMQEKAKQRGVQLLLPVDQVVSPDLESGKETFVVSLEKGEKIPAGQYGIDAGPATVKLFTEAISDCNTILWNGPIGKFEVPEFSHGTTAIATAMAEATKRGAVTVVGGGDSVSAVAAAGLHHSDFTHVSTGGGASLELMEGDRMPGLRAVTLGIA